MLSPIGGIQQQFSGGSWCLLVCRVQRRLGDKEDRIEAEGAAFLERVAQGFAELAQQRSWCAVAADQSASAVRAALERQLQEHLA